MNRAKVSLLVFPQLFVRAAALLLILDTCGAPAPSSVANNANTNANTNSSQPYNRRFRSGRTAEVIDPPAVDWSYTPTAADADTLMEAYNRAFYVQTSATSGYFRAGTASTNKHADFWKLAEEIEMVIDVYERTRAPKYSNQVVQLINGFNAVHGKNWTKNVYNDDIIWICIANLRAAQLLVNQQWADHARTNFDAVYARAWDTNFLGGGLFWKTENLTKNTCVNAPAAIAACLLWKITGETHYRDKANAMIDWVKAVLSDGHGCIYDSIKTNGTINQVSLTYNQGTYIGACNLLGRKAEAAGAADYVMRNAGDLENGFRILPRYRITGDLAGFHGIFLRWMSKYMRDEHLETKYLPWLRANALFAWSARRPTDNLSWSNWRQKTPTDPALDLPSWSCSPSVVALQTLTH